MSAEAEARLLSRGFRPRGYDAPILPYDANPMDPGARTLFAFAAGISREQAEFLPQGGEQREEGANS